MRFRTLFRRLIAGVVVAGSVGAANALTLYDPAAGTLPAGQGWTTAGTPGFVQGLAAGLYTFDTTAGNAVMAGSALSGVASFATGGAGFELDFGLRIVSEAHARADRGGFSVIVTGLDPTRALELSFWNDRVFAYTPGFVHGAEALWSTTNATAYSLVVAADRYTLYGDGSALLAGSLVDYSAFGAPYNVPGLLFFGDDTGSARSNVELGRVTVVGAVPEPTTALLMTVALIALAGFEARRRGAPAQRGSSRGLPSRSIAT